MTVRSQGERGAAMIEFALILPVLVILVFGIIEFGRAYNTQISIQAAVREGARERALGADAAETTNAVLDHLSPNLADDVVVDPGAECASGADHSTLVRATVPFEFNIPFLPPIGPDLSAKGVMRCGL